MIATLFFPPKFLSDNHKISYEKLEAINAKMENRQIELICVPKKKWRFDINSFVKELDLTKEEVAFLNKEFCYTGYHFIHDIKICKGFLTLYISGNFYK